MDETANKEKAKLIDIVRGDFTILLFLCIYGLLYIDWIIIWIFDANSPYPVFDDILGSFLTASLLIFFMSLIVVMLSRIARLKWWNAIPLTFFLMGTPFFAWILSLIAIQIARLFYIPTVKDLTEFWNDSKMKVNPRKEYFFIYEEYLETRNVETPYYFSLWQTMIAAMLGGFLGGGLMLSVNYKRIGDNKKFAFGIALSFLLHLILAFIIFGILEGNNQIRFIYLIPFLLFIPVLSNLIFKEALQENLESQISNCDLEKAPWWSVVGVTLITFIYLLFILVPIWQIYRDIESSLHSLFM